jgi:hypothetical protein
VSGQRQRSEIVRDALRLHALWRAGRLGGEQMPEDVHPRIGRSSDELAAYFTLGMSLNYQRDSYALWRACTAAFEDPSTAWVFQPLAVAAASPEPLAEALLRHRVALQPRRHPDIWRRNALGLCDHAKGRVRLLFERCAYDLGEVREFVVRHRADFPYLCGPKISSYWLYVMSSYLDWPNHNRQALTVAPDRHVIAGSLRMGLISESEGDGARQALVVADRWKEVLSGSGISQIDIHTPLWLWGRAKFPSLEELAGASDL